MCCFLGEDLPSCPFGGQCADGAAMEERSLVLSASRHPQRAGLCWAQMQRTRQTTGSLPLSPPLAPTVQAVSEDSGFIEFVQLSSCLQPEGKSRSSKSLMVKGRSLSCHHFQRRFSLWVTGFYFLSARGSVVFQISLVLMRSCQFLVFVLLQEHNVSFFPLVAFKRSSLSLFFSNLTMMCCLV